VTDQRLGRQISRQTQLRNDRRQRAAAKRARRRLIYGSIGGAFGLMLIIGLFIPQLGSLGGGRTHGVAEPAAPEIGTAVAIQPGGVIEPGAEHIAYTTTPATSGPRYADPAPWGVSDEPLADEAVLTNLERGGVAISFNLAEEADIMALQGFAVSKENYPGCLVVAPSEVVSAGSVVLTAWGFTHELTGVDAVGMDAFLAVHQNQAPLFFGADCGAGKP